MLKGLIASCLALVCGIMPVGVSTASQAAEIDKLELPAPQTGGLPLLDALGLRRSNRSFSEQPVADQDLSNLLWAAFGINRADGRRTAPTAMNSQNVFIYVARADGTWLYQAEDHSLLRVSGQNAAAGIAASPISLIYAAPPTATDQFAPYHVGSAYQNAALYCASAGLANVVQAGPVRALKQALTLPEGREIHMLQQVGWPGE